VIIENPSEMKILLINFNPPYYGNFRRSSQFGRQLVLRGHQVTLMVTSLHQRHGIKVSEFWGMRLVETPDLFAGPLRSGWDPWNVLNRIAWLRNQQFDLIHAFESRPVVIYPALFASRRGAVCLIDWADWFGKGGSVEQRPNPIVRFCLRPIETFFEEHFRPKAHANTVICSTLYKKACELGIHPVQLLLVPDGGDPEAIQAGDPIAARQRLGLPVNGMYIGYLGAIFDQDADFMLKALQIVRQSVPEVHFLWVGARPQKLTRKFEGMPNVHIFGRFSQDKMNDFLSAMDLGWLPLRNSPANNGRWPSKLNEYMCAGRPIIATNVSDLAELFERRRIGLLSKDQPEPFAKNTLDLLTNPVLRQSMGFEARKTAEEEFSWEALAGRMEEFYLLIMKQIPNKYRVNSGIV